MSEMKFCIDCEEVTKPKTHTKGSILVEIMAWLFFLLPGMIYSAWRLTSRSKVCRACSSGSIVSPDSAKAKRIMGKV